MAVDFNKELAPSVSRVNIYLIDPREIKIRPEFNGRQVEPSVDDLIQDFPNPSIGQLKPVLITKIDGQPVLLDGHRRWRAAIALTKQKLGPFDGVFKLKCSYFAGSPADCFIATVKANTHAASLPEDDGYNITRLLHNFNLSEEDIAVRVYGWTTVDGKPDVKRVRERAALADLAPESVAAMKSGKVPATAVMTLAKMSKEAQKSAIENSGSKRLTTAAIKRAAAPAPQPEAGEAPTEAPVVRKAPKKWDKKDTCELIQRYIDAELPPGILTMMTENAVRTVLGQIQEEIECGQ